MGNENNKGSIRSVRQAQYDLRKQGLKLCGTCKVILPLEQFYVQKDRQSWSSCCKECININARRRHAITGRGSYNKTTRDKTKPNDHISITSAGGKQFTTHFQVEQKRSRNTHYITNTELYYEIVVSKALGRLTPKAEKMLYLLGKNIIKKFYYANPDDRQDSLQLAYLDVFSNWYNFDEGKGTNVFSYYSEILKRGCAKSWNQLKKQKGTNGVYVKMVSLDSGNEGKGWYHNI